MKQIILIIGLSILVVFTIKAQQVPQFSQYMLNDYVLNPAIGGVHNYYQVKTSYRQQWVGINNPPSTFLISTYGPHPTKDMGFGGFIMSDNTGPISNIKFNFSYAYNMKIFNNMRLSLGMFAGAFMWKFDANSANFQDANDVLNLSDSRILPDAAFGAYLYTSQWNVGFSANQLMFNRIDKKDSLNVVSRLTSHFNLMGRYRYMMNRDIDLEGSSLIKFVYPLAPEFELDVRGIYRKMFWGGFGFRTGENALSFFLGYNQGLVDIGYSYDLVLSPIRSYNGGSHEIIIGVRFANIKHSGSSRRSIR